MSKKKVFRSIEEIQKEYFPKTYEKEKIEKMSAKELGEYLADKSLKKIKKNMGVKNDQEKDR